MSIEDIIKDEVLKGDERSVRIFEEFLKTRDHLEKQEIKNTIVMFGSARTNPSDKYYKAAHDLACKLALWSRELFLTPKDKFYICTGGGGGIMEAANKGSDKAGEPTVGFNIQLPFEQSANDYISNDLVFDFHYFFIRKFFFAYLAKAFVIFPGGFGTFDELFEILTLAQTRKMQKTMPFVIFGKEYFDQVINFDAMLEHGYISQKDKELYIVTDSVQQAFEHITQNIQNDKLSFGF